MMNLRIMRVFLFVLLLASFEVQARILQEQISYNSMVDYRFSSAKMIISSTIRDVLRCVADSFWWQKLEYAVPTLEKKTKPPVEPPPSPEIAPPQHRYGHQLPYESPPNPFLQLASS